MKATYKFLAHDWPAPRMAFARSGHFAPLPLARRLGYFSFPFNPNWISYA